MATEMNRTHKVFPEYGSVMAEWAALIRELGLVRKEKDLLAAVELPYPNKNFEIGLSSRCNFDCPFCYNHADRFYAYYGATTIDPELFRAFILRNAPFQNFVFAVTGEPFLYPDILNVLKFTYDHVDTLNFSTNGSLLTPEVVDFLSECNMNFINISVDGAGARYAEFRRGGEYERFRKNVSRLVEQLDEKVYFAATVFNRNHDALLELPDAAAQMGVRHLHLFGLNTHPRMAERGIRNLNKTELEGFLPGLMDRCRSAGVTPHWAPSFIAEDLNDATLKYLGIDRTAEENRYRERCYLPFERINVDPLGHVNFCCYLEFLPADALNQPLSAWWNMKEVKVLRIMNLTHRFPGVCQTFCHKIPDHGIPLDPETLYRLCEPFRTATSTYLRKREVVS